MALSRLKLIVILLVVAAFSTAALFPSSLALVVGQLLLDGPILLAWVGACWGFGSAVMLACRVILRSDSPGQVRLTRAPGARVNDYVATGPPTNDEATSLFGESAGQTIVLHFITRAAIGIGIASLLVLFLGSVGVLNRVVAIALLVVGNVSTIAQLHRHQDKIRNWLCCQVSPHQLILAVAMPILAATVVGALVIPGILYGDEPHPYDVLAYHLQLPREWFEAGRIAATPHNVFGYFPLNVEMHYLLAITLRGSATGGMFLAQLMHAGMMILTLGAVYGAVRSVKNSVGNQSAVSYSPPLAGGAEGGGEARSSVRSILDRDSGPHPSPLPEGEGTGRVASSSFIPHPSSFPASVAVVFCAAFPWMLMLGSVAYNECGLMLFTTLAVVWTLRQRWLLAGVCAGFAAACKITAVPTLIALLPAIVLLESLTRRSVGWRVEWRGVAMFLLGSILTLSPWLIRTASIAHGNPVFPIAARSLGSAYFDAGMVERFEVAHSARPDQQSVVARFAALNEQVFRDFKYGSTSIGSVSVPLLLVLIVPALVIRRRERSAWVLCAFIVGNVVVWLFATHLQGRFIVPIIPVAAMLVAGVPSRAWSMFVLVLSITTLPLSYARVSARLMKAESGIGFPDPSFLLPDPLVKLIQSTDRPIYLVGDGRAFLYLVPAGRLHYRSVFDVPSNESFKDAWLGNDVPSDAIVVVSPSELERFEKTYRNLPKVPDAWRGRGMFATDAELKVVVPVE